MMTAVNRKIHLSSSGSLESPLGTLQVFSLLEGTSWGLVSHVEVEAMEVQSQYLAHVVTSISAVIMWQGYE